MTNCIILIQPISHVHQNYLEIFSRKNYEKWEHNYGTRNLGDMGRVNWNRSTVLKVYAYTHGAH